MQDLCGKGGCSGKALGVMLWHYARSLDGWEVLVNGREKCVTRRLLDGESISVRFTSYSVYVRGGCYEARGAVMSSHALPR